MKVSRYLPKRLLSFSSNWQYAWCTKVWKPWGESSCRCCSVQYLAYFPRIHQCVQFSSLGCHRRSGLTRERLQACHTDFRANFFQRSWTPRKTRKNIFSCWGSLLDINIPIFEVFEWNFKFCNHHFDGYFKVCIKIDFKIKISGIENIENDTFDAKFQNFEISPQFATFTRGKKRSILGPNLKVLKFGT